MTFTWIEMLWLLLIVPALVAAYWLVQRGRRKYALRYASLSLVKEALGRGPGVRRHVPPMLFVLGVAVMVLALARPYASIVMPSQQATVILAIDVSGSMRADDLKPNRMEAAKVAARAFVERQPRNVRIGVVSFSDGASLVQAPTKEKEAVVGAIDFLTTQRGTAMGRGMLTSLEAILGADAVADRAASPRDSLPLGEPKRDTAPSLPGSYQAGVIVLLSDGQSNVGPSPIDAAERAASRGVRVYTVGVGKREGAILGVEGRSIRVVLDEETLKRIAQDTGGSYFNAETESDLSQIYRDLSTRLIAKPERTELTAAFTGLAAVIMLTAGMLSLLWFSRLP